MNAKKLSELLIGFEFEPSGNLDLMISGIQYDSRKVNEGCLFVCIPGLKADGHDFAQKAISQGAQVLVVEKWLEVEIDQIKVPNSRQALGLISSAFFSHPSHNLRVFGVTGTNGKTTVTHLLEHILTRAGNYPGIIGTLGARIGKAEFPGSRTTPESSDLQALLAEMVSRKCDAAIMEVSSHALDLHRVAGCEYDVAVFTNLTQDHLDYHADMQSYLAAKGKLFSSLGINSTKQGCKYAVINCDDSAAHSLSRISKVKRVTYGLVNVADYKAENILYSTNGVEFEVVFNDNTQKISMCTPGMFTVYNALAAFAVAIEEGILPALAANALAEVKGVPGRFEPVVAGQPFGVIVDYAHTPDSLENVINTARGFVNGNLITVFGCGGDRDKTKRPIMGEIATRLSDVSIVTSDNPRSERPEAIIADVLVGVKEASEKIARHHLIVEDRHEAIMLACKMAKPGDIVIIAGKGHEDYQEINGRKYPFDDRVVAKECLMRLGYE